MSDWLKCVPTLWADKWQMTAVIIASKMLKVLGAIVSFDAVHVVDNVPSIERTPKNFTHNNAMLKNVSAFLFSIASFFLIGIRMIWHQQHDVACSIDFSTTLPPIIVRTAIGNSELPLALWSMRGAWFPQSGDRHILASLFAELARRAPQCTFRHALSSFIRN